MSDGVRRKDTVEHADPRLRHEQAAGELGGPGTPSHGQRQSQAVVEEGLIERWVNENSPVRSVWIEVGPKSLIELKGGKVIGAPRKGPGVGQLRASEDGWRRRAI